MWVVKPAMERSWGPRDGDGRED